MKPRTSSVPKARKANSFHCDGPSWVLIAGGALLSTLSIRLGFKLKQALDSKHQENAVRNSGNEKSSDRRKSATGHFKSNRYSFTEDGHGWFSCISANEGTVEVKCPPNGQVYRESDGTLPLVAVPPPEYNRDNSAIWASSPDCLELPPKRFQISNCPDSPSVSESGSDIFSKREVIQKLRQQLKRRDDMILEMHDQIMELQNSLKAEVLRSSNLQMQLDGANAELFDSVREIQRLRKAIADHYVGNGRPHDNYSMATTWLSEALNSYANGYHGGDNNFERSEKGGDGERIEKLKREEGDLKELIEGKEYSLQDHKGQTAELKNKVKELQQRLDSQLPNFL